MKINAARVRGFTLVEMMIVVAIIALLAAIAIPNWVRARSTSQTNSCINNLRQIDGAKQQWGLDIKAGPTSLPTLSDIQPYLGRGTNGSAPACPNDNTQQFANSYTMGNLATVPTCKVDTNNHVLPP